MSLVVTVYVPEGLVMAADSRLTLEFELPQASGPPKHHSIPSSDSTYKVFLIPSRIGISTFGAAAVETTPVAPLVEAFAAKELQAAAKPPDEVAEALLQHFRTLAGPPAVRFHVAGYKGTEQEVFDIDVAGNVAKQVNTSGPGAAWGGEADALSRLLSRVGTLDQAGKFANELPLFGVAFQHFTLQDAIDFAVYAIRTTADTMRFQMRPQTVGGPIDILVIRPTEARWLRRKELRIVDTA
jgi:20S proteasome alpha/beta subunit